MRFFFRPNSPLVVILSFLPPHFLFGVQPDSAEDDPPAPFSDDERPDGTIVFCYAGELYTVPEGRRIARRLTSGPGYTSFPHFSPDGKQLAFTSQYDGNTEVYVMPGGRWRAEAPDHDRDARRATMFPTGWGRTTS